MNKRSYLLTHAVYVPHEEPQGGYDVGRSVRIHSETGEPLVLIAERARTNSKTLSRPGDDDPDPGAQTCY
jgi:hypothetical protein